MDAGGKWGCSVNWDGWGKAFSGHSANRRRDVLGRGNSKCKWPETGQSLTRGGSRETSVAGTEGAEGRAAGDEIRGGGGQMVQSLRDRYVCFGFNLVFGEALEALEPRSDIRFTF